MSIENAKLLKLQAESSTPEAVCASLLESVAVAACATTADYDSYKAEVRKVVGGEVEDVFIAGSGNWGFSLNPEKRYRAFGDHSDIDLCIISQSHFDEIWLAIRAYHRKNFYQLGFNARTSLRRNGENVYSGFVTPMWISERSHKLRIDFELKLNALSNVYVGYKRVNAFIFKNRDEAVDYYKRAMVTLLKDKQV